MARSSVSVRVASLEEWPRKNLFNLTQLAKSGLYYLGRNDDVRDRLRCAFCEFIVADINGSEDLLKMHASFVPLCWKILTYKGREFVQSVVEEEKSCQIDQDLSDDEMYTSRPRSASLLRSDGLTILEITNYLVKNEQSSSKSPRSGQLVTDRGCSFTKPKHPDMVDPQKRLNSLVNKDEIFTALRPPNNVIEAGFFFTGYGDNLLCYYCGTSWKRDYDPWKQHALDAPHCMHVILTKGEEFIEKVFEDISGETRRALSAHNECHGKRKREQEQEDLMKEPRLCGINDQEGRQTDKNVLHFTVPQVRRRHQHGSFQDESLSGITEETSLTCEICGAVGNITSGFVSVSHHTFRCSRHCKS